MDTAWSGYSMGMQHGEMNMHYGHGYAARTWSYILDLDMRHDMDMQHGHGHAAQAWICNTGMGSGCTALKWTCSIDIHIQHGNGPAALIWTCCMDKDMQHEQGHAAWTFGHASWAWAYSMDMDMQHGHGH